MALALIAKAFKLNYLTPTNNNQRISSNPRNRQIAQPGMNMGQDRQMQMVGGNGGNQFRQYAGQNAGNLNGYNAVQNVGNQVAQNPRVQNVGNQNGQIGVQGNGNQNQIGNGILMAVRVEGNAAGHNGNQLRCYNCRGVGHFARDCTARPRRRDAAYLQTQLLIAQKEEAGIQLQAEEYDLMAAAADLDEIKEVSANCILMANLQQASSSGTQTDSTPVYDSDRSAEVHEYENCYNNEIFNMFTQEEQYTELLEPIPESHQVPQNNNDVISEDTRVEQGEETVEQHSANFEETRALYESLYQNLAVEVEKVNSVNRKLKETNADLTTELARPFLSTTHAIINVYEREIIIRQNQQSLTIQCSDIPFVKKVKQINKIDFINAGGIDFESEEIEDFLNDDSIPFGVEDSPFNMDEDILFLEKRTRREHVDYINRIEMLFTINLRPHNPTNDSTNVESFSSFPISNQESEPRQEEIDVVFVTNDVLPPSNDDSDEEVDAVGDLCVDNFIQNSEHEYSKSEDSDFDNPLLPLSPPEPPDKEFDFEKEISVVRNMIVKFECIDAKVKFDVFNDENDVLSYFMFVIFAKEFSLLFAESEDTIFNPEPPDKEFDFEKEISVVRNMIVKFECIDAKVKFDVFNDENYVLSYFMFVIFAKEFSLLFAESEDTIFNPGFSPVDKVFLCWIFVRFLRSSYLLIDSSLGKSISFDLYCLAVIFPPLCSNCKH
nr:hypothetical protein [Tanacetum cinerariifolium]